MQIKRCTKCKENHPASNFHRFKNAKDGLQSYCKDCKRTYNVSRAPRVWDDSWKRYYKEYRKKIKDLNYKSRQSLSDDEFFNNETSQEIYLRRRYGISIEQFSSLLEIQNGECAGCRSIFSSTPNVDHCHTTGVVRGLLCHRCNTALGLLRDDTSTLNRLASYLESPPIGLVISVPPQLYI